MKRNFSHQINGSTLTMNSMKHDIFLKYICITLILFGITFAFVPESFALMEKGQEGTSVATVIVDGSPLFRVYGTATLPAKHRAKAISERIKTLARNSSFETDKLKIKEVDDLVEIYAGDQHIVDIFEEDAHIEGSFSPKTLTTELILPQIISAIHNYRIQREPSVLLKNIFSAFVRTVLLSLFLFLLFWAFKKFNQFLELRFTRKIEKLEAKSLQILKAKQIWSVLKTIIRLVWAVLILTILYFFINLVLNLFPWTRYVSQNLLGYVTNPLFSIVKAIIDYLPDLFFLIILFFVVRYLLRITHAFFKELDHGHIRFKGFEAEWAFPTYRIIRVFMIIFAVVVAYPYMPGSGSDAFKGVSLLLGVLFSIGSSSLIANVIAGYTMTYRRAFKVGDRVKIGDNIGDVSQIRLLVTHLKSLKNEEIVIPNSTILNTEITNYTSLASKRGLILHTTVSIGYEVPSRQVEAMLLMAAARTEGLHRTAQHFVLETGLGDFGTTYELNVFSKKPDKTVQIYSNLHRNIKDVFNEYEVSIMTPHYTGDTVEPKIVPKEKWFAAPAKASPHDT
jgi:small-conductance mechanosensitive channel